MQESGKRIGRSRRIEGQAKRWLSFLMSVVLVFSMCSGSGIAVAAGETITIDKGEESSESSVVSEDSPQQTQGKYDISMSEGTDQVTAELVELAQAGTYKLVVSGSGRMKDMSSADRPWQEQINVITELEIKGAVSYIGASAFRDMESLGTVYFSSQADGFEIGNKAFSSCINLKVLDFAGVNLTAIGNSAFAGCTSLQTITFPTPAQTYSLTVEESAFERCRMLGEVVFPKQAKTTIREEAFRCCDNLTKVYALHPETSFVGEYIFLEDANINNNNNKSITIACQKNSQADEFCVANDYATAEYVDEDGKLIPKKKYTVSFIDYDGDIIKSAPYEEGYLLTSQDAPSVEREGYILAGWNPTLTEYEVKEDTTFTAVYEYADKSEFDISASGEGNQVVYELSEDGVLTITGSGAIKDFGGEKDCPWYEERENITSVIFLGAITRIGNNTCKGLKRCETISLTGITKKFSIGRGAFENTAVADLVLPANTSDVASTAFWATESLQSVSIYGGTYHGNPFLTNKYLGDDYPVFSFFKTANITLVADSGTQFLQNVYGNMCNLVFDDAAALDKYASVIYWTYVNDLYVPNGENAFGALSALKDAGCNVGYEFADGNAVIRYVSAGDSASQLNLPEYILNHLVTAVTCDVPSGVTILHENSPHQTKDGVCQICRRKQYSSTKQDDKWLIRDFDEETDYYVIIVDSQETVTTFELAESFILHAGKTLRIPKGYTLIVPAGCCLQVEPDARLILDGTIVVEKNGTFVNYGEITGNGSFLGDGAFITSPNSDTIRFGNEDELYDNNPDFQIIIIYVIDWWGAEFEVSYEETQEYYEKFTGTYEREEYDDSKWIRVSEDELKHHGIYRYVYVDPRTGKKITKRFVVKKPYGQASVALEDWYYGDAPKIPTASSSTNADVSHIFYYKKVAESEAAYQRTKPSEPGKYNVRVKYLGNEDYQQAVSSSEFEIKKRPITVTIEDETREYGQANPASYSFDVTGGMGFVNSDTIDDLNIRPLCTATPASNVGEYDITATVQSDYYDVTVETGTLTITPMQASLSLDPNYASYTKTYGDDIFTLQGLSKTGDGALVYEVCGTQTDVASVDENGEVTIQNAGQTTIRVSLPDTQNAIGAAPVLVTVNVSKAAAPAAFTDDVYYLRTKSNAIQIPLTDYLPKDFGSADFTDFDANTDVTYTGCDQTLFRSPLSVDGQGILHGENVYTANDCNAMLEIVVSMRNYEDSKINLNLHFISRQELKIADGQAVALVKDGLTYGNPLSSLTFQEVTFVGTNTNKPVEGTLAFQTPDEKPEVGSGRYEAGWIFTPADVYGGLYDALKGTVTVTMYQAEPEITTLPETDSYVYDTKRTLEMIPIVGGNTSTSGTWKWADETIVPEYDNLGYDALFIPDSPNYRVVTQTIVVSIYQATPFLTNKPVVSAINYLDALENANISGGTVEYKSLVSANDIAFTIRGDFHWKNGAIKPFVSDSEKTEYDMVFTPYDDNYKEITFPMTVTVNKAGKAPGYQSGEQKLNVTNDIKTMAQVSGLPTDWKWADADAEKSISQNSTISVTAVYDGIDQGCYVFEEMTYQVSRAACVMGDTLFYTEAEDVRPTCLQDGIAHKECSICHDILQKNITVEKLGHAYQAPEYTWSVSENAFDTTAEATFLCGREGCPETDEDHRIDLPCEVTFETTEPLCEVDGKIDYHAKVIFEGTVYDEEEKIVAVNKLGHDMLRVNKDNEEKEYGFTWIRQNTGEYVCSVRYLCSRCQHSEILSDTATSVCTATCTEDGETVYSVSINSIYEDTVLSATKREDTLAMGHRFFNTEYTRIETCTEDGYWTKRCNFPGCKAYTIEYRPKLGHTGGTATCVHPAVCTRCKTPYGDVDPENHEADQITIINAASQTCTANGYSGDTKCMACDTVLKQGDVLPMFGKHTWDNGVELKKATALEKGQIRYTCKDCGLSRIQVVYFDPGKQEPEETADDQNKDIYHVTVEEKNPDKPIVIYVKPVKPEPIVVIPSVVVIAGRELEVTRMEEGAFKADNTVTTVQIGKKVTEIPKQCFYGAKKLKKVTVSDSVTKIGSQAFAGCKKLTTVNMGKNVTEIGDKAFANCPKLKKVTIPAKVTTIGSSVFTGNKALKVIVIRSMKLKANKLKKNAFKGVSAAVVIKVPKTKLKSYKKMFLKKGLSKKVKVIGM